MDELIKELQALLKKHNAVMFARIGHKGKALISIISGTGSPWVDYISIDPKEIIKLHATTKR